MKRVHYHEGMLLTARDFRDEQAYHLEKRRLANRSLHGYGTVCGLRVVAARPRHPHRVRVEAGVALDAAGNEIVLPRAVTVDLSELPGSVSLRRSRTLYLALRYREEEVGAAPVPGSDEPVPTRILESHEFVLLLEPPPMPEAGRRARPPEDLRRALGEALLGPCPRAGERREVTLAAIRYSSRQPIGARRIDNLGFRPLALPLPTRLLLELLASR